jgi:hypothetical protein
MFFLLLHHLLLKRTSILRHGFRHRLHRLRVICSEQPSRLQAWPSIR